MCYFGPNEYGGPSPTDDCSPNVGEGPSHTRACAHSGPHTYAQSAWCAGLHGRRGSTGAQCRPPHGRLQGNSGSIPSVPKGRASATHRRLRAQSALPPVFRASRLNRFQCALSHIAISNQSLHAKSPKPAHEGANKEVRHTRAYPVRRRHVTSQKRSHACALQKSRTIFP